MLQRPATLSLVAGAALAAGLGGRATPAAAQPLARAGRPEEAGLSADRLGRLAAWMGAEVEG